MSWMVSEFFYYFQAREPSFPTTFKFAILFAGFKSQSSKHSQWYNVHKRLPSFLSVFTFYYHKNILLSCKIIQLEFKQFIEMACT